jgi:hypothetical protein
MLWRNFTWIFTFLAYILMMSVGYFFDAEFSQHHSLWVGLGLFVGLMNVANDVDDLRRKMEAK